jgi:hypothetical protein
MSERDSFVVHAPPNVPCWPSPIGPAAATQHASKRPQMIAREISLTNVEQANKFTTKSLSADVQSGSA